MFVQDGELATNSPNTGINYLGHGYLLSPDGEEIWQYNGQIGTPHGTDSWNGELKPTIEKGMSWCVQDVSSQSSPEHQN